MSILSVFFIAAGLAADAFAVAVVKGLCSRNPRLEGAFMTAFMFGLFQFLMPCIGFFSSRGIVCFIAAFSNPLAFFVLSLIGGKMLFDSFHSSSPQKDETLSIGGLLLPAIATSTDALAVGVTTAAFENRILPYALIIGAFAFLFSFIGFFIGKHFGKTFEHYGELFGGLILILMGIKFLFTYL